LSAAHFRRALLKWYDAGHRDLPWRQLSGDGADVFYRVWLSEIMLQQTRVEAVIPYYERFLRRFPSVERLASATEQEVLTAWSGLGYYSRARNIHHVAKQIATEGLPSGYEEIRGLRGIGEYTTAAIASIALGLAHAAVDGNVMRVIARLTNDASEITTPATRRKISEAAQGLLDATRPGDFNQAMMELGATVCTPTAPGCNVCPVGKFCEARQAGTQLELPVRLKKKVVRELALDLAIVERAGSVLLVKRASSERRLADFWELPGKKALPRMRSRKIAEFRHQIVNDRFLVTVWRMSVPPGDPESIGLGDWIPATDLGRYPVTTVAKKALAQGLEQKNPRETRLPPE
jgi:A/G-specific adenine glycosylase